MIAFEHQSQLFNLQPDCTEYGLAYRDKKALNLQMTVGASGLENDLFIISTKQIYITCTYGKEYRIPCSMNMTVEELKEKIISV